MTTDSPKGPEREVRPSKELIDYLRRLLGQRFDELLATANFLDEDDQASTLAVFEDVLPLIGQEIANRAAAYDLMMDELRGQRAVANKCASEQQERADQSWAQITEARAEVSRLREQLAAQPTLPDEAVLCDRIERAQSEWWHGENYTAAGHNEDPANCCWCYEAADVAAKTVHALLVGVSSSEAEAPQPPPVQHLVQINPLDEGYEAWCPSCRTGSTGCKQDVQFWKDQHEADTLRPQAFADYDLTDVKPGNGFFVPKDDEGRPSGSGRLAPRSGVELIADERARQVAVEGWTPEHDAQYDSDDLARAALCYLRRPEQRQMMLLYDNRPVGWPWGSASWKPSDDRVRELVKAAALIAAEIDRLQAQDAAPAARSEATPEALPEVDPDAFGPAGYLLRPSPAVSTQEETKGETDG